ncbi:MAG: GNAT family N-acetyltransferase [Gemmatimonadetes bacterium]|nr:GNAT family N-acetyltransferase [Gemmatimonadota bacterium]
MTIVTETGRLVLRHFTTEDAEFVLRLLNEPSFIENIGDRGVRTVEDAVAYLNRGPIDSYARHGHGLNAVVLRETGEPIGMCGLLRREQFADADVGYSFLPEFWRRGYAAEAVAAVVEHGRRTLGLRTIIAIVAPHNTASSALLEKLGFRYEERVELLTDGSDVMVYRSSGATSTH